MVKAAILDEHGEEISKFTALPSKKRFFIMGAEKNLVLPENLRLLTYAQLMEQNRTESVGRDTDDHNVPLLLRKSVNSGKSYFVLFLIYS